MIRAPAERHFGLYEPVYWLTPNPSLWLAWKEGLLRLLRSFGRAEKAPSFWVGDESDDKAVFLLGFLQNLKTYDHLWGRHQLLYLQLHRRGRNTNEIFYDLFWLLRSQMFIISNQAQIIIALNPEAPRSEWSLFHSDFVRKPRWRYHFSCVFCLVSIKNPFIDNISLFMLDYL